MTRGVSPALLLALPLSLTSVDARGCGRITIDGVVARGGPVGLCVKQVVWAPLEGGLVAALVEAPHRFDPRVRNRVFVYRLEGNRLAPRFLGSGFSSRDVVRLVQREDALGLEVTPLLDPTGTGNIVLRCRFDGFPLVCSEEP